MHVQEYGIGTRNFDNLAQKNVLVNLSQTLVNVAQVLDQLLYGGENLALVFLDAHDLFYGFAVVAGAHFEEFEGFFVHISYVLGISQNNPIR